MELALGRLMRLAKDWEFVETWSSGTNLDRWVFVAGVLLGEAVPAARNDEYDCEDPAVAERPLVTAGLPSLTAFREVVRRGSAEGGRGPFCSNLLVMSFTLARAAAGTALPVAERNLVPSEPGGANLSSTGFDAERCVGLVEAREAGAAGSLEEFPLLVDREGGAWRLVETAEAIESWVRSGTRLCFAAKSFW